MDISFTRQIGFFISYNSENFFFYIIYTVFLSFFLKRKKTKFTIDMKISGKTFSNRIPVNGYKNLTTMISVIRQRLSRGPDRSFQSRSQ